MFLPATPSVDSSNTWQTMELQAVADLESFCPDSPVTRGQMAVFLVAAPPPLNP